MLGSAVLGSFYLASATAQTPGLPPPLPTGAKAILWARSKIARSNATRSNYIRPHITILLTQYRYPNPPITVDLTMWARLDSTSVTQAINDEPDSCSLTLKPETPAAYYPLVGDVIQIGLATEATVPDYTQIRVAAGYEFGGPVIVTQHDRRPKNQSPWISVQCQDWQAFFDAQLVNATWPAQSASITIADLLARFVNYSQIVPAGSLLPFALTYVPTNLPSCAAFTAVNWRPSQVIRHLANEMEGGFYIDPTRALHVWASGPEPNQSDPQPLKNFLGTLKTFRHRSDASQVRRRVMTEGMGTTILVDVPGLNPPALYAGGIPVADARPFVGSERGARLGSQWVRVQITHTLQPDVENPFAAHATVAFNYATDGTLTVDAWPYFLTLGSGGWVKVGEQYLRYDSSGGSAGAYTLRVNQGYFPFGRAIASIKAGEVVTWVDWIDNWQKVAHDSTAALVPIDAALAGTELVVLAEAIDLDAAQPWAIHLPPYEAVVQDARYGYIGAQTRATDDVNFFRLPLLHAEWLTDDYNARPGRPQTILLTDPDAVSAVLTILSVNVTFPLRSLAPRRQCAAALVKPATLLDVLTTSST